jgi:hypothetical protein
VLFSLCIPTRNRASHLREAILATDAWAGAGIAFEVVVCDNHSSDETPHLLRTLAVHRPHLRAVRQRQPVSHAANKAAALRAGRGEWCVYLADDDSHDPTVLLTLLERLRGQKELAACYTPATPWDAAAGKPLGNYWQVPEAATFSRRAPLELLNHVLTHRIYPEVGLWRRAVLDAAPLLAAGAYYAHFWLFQLLRHGDIQIEPLSFYREHLITAPHLPPRATTVHGTIGLGYADGLRAGLEAALHDLLQAQGQWPLPQALRGEIQEAILTLVSERLMVLRNQLIGQTQWQEAWLLEKRIRLWHPPGALGTQSQGGLPSRDGLLILALLDAVAERASATPGVTRVCYVGRFDQDALRALGERYPALSLERAGACPEPAPGDPETLWALPGARPPGATHHLDTQVVASHLAGWDVAINLI